MKNLMYLSAILIGFAVFYYFVLFLPQKEKERQDWEQRQALFKDIEKSSNGKLLQSCLDEVVQRFGDMAEKNKNLVVNNEQAKLLVDVINKQKEECFKKYPQQ